MGKESGSVKEFNKHHMYDGLISKFVDKNEFIPGRGCFQSEKEEMGANSGAIICFKVVLPSIGSHTADVG